MSEEDALVQQLKDLRARIKDMKATGATEDAITNETKAMKDIQDRLKALKSNDTQSAAKKFVIKTPKVEPLSAPLE